VNHEFKGGRWGDRFGGKDYKSGGLDVKRSGDNLEGMVLRKRRWGGPWGSENGNEKNARTGERKKNQEKGLYGPNGKKKMVGETALKNKKPLLWLAKDLTR